MDFPVSSPLNDLSAATERPPPWLSDYVPLAERVLRLRRADSVAVALNGARNDTDTICFVAQSALPDGEPYEAFIRRTGSVPTRDNLHDLFNGLMWLTYPRTKRRLNELQAEQIASNGIGSTRGALRDALTLFDENAAILQAPPILIDALRCRDWKTLFVTQREQWRSARLRVFGHALMEKLLHPRKSITAHAWISGDLSDESVAASLEPERLASKAFLPLPVLGVPGWWPANEDPHFYDDADVFRPLHGAPVDRR